jgi:TonB-linked SusC/RagA family outer membrane protein
MIACKPPDKVFPIGKTLTIFLLACVVLSLSSQAQDTDTIQVLPKNPPLLKVTDEEPVLFGVQKKNRLLQSTATVYTDQLSTTPNPQFIQALPGRLTGLNVRSFGIGPGLDGNGTTFDVRGARAQVILIDGVERGYMSIDPEQIESITLLKDALSTVMFGQRSSYGIISVKTKKGDVGKPRISFTAQSGIETPTALPKPLPAWQQATLYNEAQRNDFGQAATSTYSQAQIDAYRDQTDPYTYPDVNWYKTVLKKNAPISRYNLNIQGSGKGFRYFVDLDKLTEKGLLKTDNNNPYNTNVQLDRYILRSNLGAEVTPTTFVQLNLFGRFQRYNQPGGGVSGILLSLLTTPQSAFPVYNPDGTYSGLKTYGDNANIYGQAVSRGYMFTDVRDIAVDLDVTQKLDVLTKGLYIKARASNNNTASFSTFRTKNFDMYQYSNNTYTKLTNATEQTTSGGPNERSRIVYIEGVVGYDRTFGKHAINVMAVGNQQSRLAFNSTNLPETYTAYAGRLNYAYNDKYLLEGAVSYGGYNWLTPAKRWATYWAGGLGWNVHNERFIKENLSFISNLKLRANYGVTGQANAGYFSYIQTYYNNLTNTNNGVAYWYGPGSSLERSTGENTIANPNIGPEKAKKLSAGADLGFFNNKLTVTADYFYNKFHDIVGLPTMTTAVFGATYPMLNYQKFNYYGGEMMVTWQDQIKGLAYYISGNLSLVQSKVVYNGELPKQYDYQVLTGKPVGMLYGYTATGLFKSFDEVLDPATAVLPAAPKPDPNSLVFGTLRPGDIRYLDRNGDGVIDENDKSAIGNGKPGISFGGNIGFRFKGFDFSALVQGTINRQSYISGDFMNGLGNGGSYTGYEYNLGRFTDATAETATQPRVWIGTNTNNNQISNFWLRDNDFVRLKNVELGYTLPQKLMRRIGGSTVRFFANGLNLLTWAEIYKVRKDLDPESWGLVYPVMKVLNFGINVKF